MNKETLRMQMLSGVITESEYKAKLEESSTKESLKDLVKEENKEDDYYIHNESDEFEEVYTVKRYSGGFSKSFNDYEQAREYIKNLRQNLRQNSTKESLNENFVGMGMVGNIFDREKTDYELAFEHFTKGKMINESDDDLEDLIDWAQTKLWGDFDYDEYEVKKMPPQKLYSELENLIYKNDPDYPKFKEFESMLKGTLVKEETMQEGVSKDDEKLYLAFIKAANFLKGGGSDTEAWEMMWDEYPYM